jgi:hypothetical protein
MLPDVLYASKIVSLILSEEHRLEKFEIILLTRISGLKREEETGDNNGLLNYYTPLNIMVINSKRIR